MNKDRRRKKKLIGRLQCRFVGFLLGYFLLIMITLGAILVVPPIIQLRIAESDFSVVSAAATQLLYLHSRLWPAMAVVLLLFVVHAVIFSHRIAGPLHRIRRLLREVGNGDLGMEVRIRRKDLLHLEVEAINEMLRDLEGRVRRLDEASGRAEAALCSLELSGSGSETFQGAELRTAIDDMREAVAEFRLHHASGRDPADERHPGPDPEDTKGPGSLQDGGDRKEGDAEATAEKIEV
jgi:methyl-accepting chemotaxis protein